MFEVLLALTYWDIGTQFVENTEEIWSYCGQPNHYKTAFMVIGPITRVTQMATGKPSPPHHSMRHPHVWFFFFPLMTAKLLVEQLKSKFEEKAILLTVRPICIEGKRTSKQFYKFVPPKE